MSKAKVSRPSHRPAPPPPPPPVTSQKTSNVTSQSSSTETSLPSKETTMDNSEKVEGDNVRSRSAKTTQNCEPKPDNKNVLKLNVDLDPKSRSSSSSSVGSSADNTGKSPRLNFRKSRPAPPPPKPPDKSAAKAEADSNKDKLLDSMTPKVPLDSDLILASAKLAVSDGSQSNGSDAKSAIDNKSGCNHSDVNKAPSSSAKSSAVSETLDARDSGTDATHNKSITKPASASPLPSTPPRGSTDADHSITSANITASPHSKQIPVPDTTCPLGPNTRVPPHKHNSPQTQSNHTRLGVCVKGAVGVKPAIKSPKPKLKPIVPPPAPPSSDTQSHLNNQSCENNSSVPVIDDISSIKHTPTSTTTNDSSQSNDSSILSTNVKVGAEDNGSMSDLMRDVLGVIDGDIGRGIDHQASISGAAQQPASAAGTQARVIVANNQSNSSSFTQHSKQENIDNVPTLANAVEKTNRDSAKINESQEVLEITQTNNETSNSFKDVVDSVNNIPENTPSASDQMSPLTVQIDTDEFDNKAAVLKEDKVETNKRDSQISSQYSPMHKPSIHSRAQQNSPKRNRVKRKKSALGFLLCCGLGGHAYLRDKSSPPLELPEGATFPRGGVVGTGSNNVVKSASLPSNIVSASHSPKCLEQKDVVSSSDKDVSHVSNIALNATKNKPENKPHLDSNNECSEKENYTNSRPSSESPPRDIIDVLCQSEAPITIDKLQGDNKDLVVNHNENTYKPATLSTFAAPPVVHGVKLVKVERSSTFSSTANLDHSRASTPGLSNTQLNPPDMRLGASQFKKNRSPYSSFTSNYSEPPSKNVKMRPNSDTKAIARDRDKVRSQSLENLSCITVDLDLPPHLERNEYRSSFVGDDSQQSIPAMTRAPGEVQTLMKHSSQDKVYALPQPACYGDNTLKAVKRITDKYDTLERWKICATSFRGDGTGRKTSGVASPVTSPSRQASRESAEVIEENPQQSEYTHGNENVEELENNVFNEANQDYLLSPKEKNSICLFYSSRETSVTVANCEIDFMTSVKEVEQASDVKEWTPPQKGIPGFVLNSGEGRSRRELSIVVADRGTSFPIWTDKVNHLSQYQALTDTMHTMHLSTSLLRVAAFQFPDITTATDFMDKFKELTKDANDDLWKVCVEPKSKAKKKKSAANKPRVKGDISQPIQFDHVTNVSAQDTSLTDNLSDYVKHGGEEGSEEVCEINEPYRTRVCTS